MTKQTYLVEFIDKENLVIDFYRHGQKKLATVLAQEKKYFSNEYENFKKYNSGLYKKLFNKDIKIKVYQTEYETNDDNLVYENNFIDFLTNTNIA